MIPHYRLPRMIERGASQVLTLPVYAADGTAQATASSGTVSIYAGSTAIVTDAAVSVGPPAAYTLAGSATTDQSLSEEWLEIWKLTISGTEYTFQRPAYLVRRVLYATLIDADLVEYHSDLLSLLDPDESNLQKYRDNAWSSVQTALIRKGRRPQLVIDSWQLRQLHAFRTLELFFRDAASSVGDGRYIELAREYGELAAEEWAALSFRYDASEDGYIGTALDETTAGSGVVYLSAPKATY
jgi:hypothetical protein